MQRKGEKSVLYLWLLRLVVLRFIYLILAFHYSSLSISSRLTQRKCTLSCSCSCSHALGTFRTLVPCIRTKRRRQTCKRVTGKLRRNSILFKNQKQTFTVPAVTFLQSDSILFSSKSKSHCSCSNIDSIRHSFKVIKKCRAFALSLWIMVNSVWSFTAATFVTQIVQHTIS